MAQNQNKKSTGWQLYCREHPVRPEANGKEPRRQAQQQQKAAWQALSSGERKQYEERARKEYLDRAAKQAVLTPVRMYVRDLDKRQKAYKGMNLLQRVHAVKYDVKQFLNDPAAQRRMARRAKQYNGSVGNAIRTGQMMPPKEREAERAKRNQERFGKAAN